jgi:hypothetical protein
VSLGRGLFDLDRGLFDLDLGDWSVSNLKPFAFPNREFFFFIRVPPSSVSADPFSACIFFRATFLAFARCKALIGFFFSLSLPRRLRTLRGSSSSSDMLRLI